MISFYKKYWRTVFDIALIVLTVYLFMLLFSYLYAIATPIFLALIIFMMIEPLARFLNRKGMRKSLASAISTLVFVLIILGALAGAAVIFTSQIMSLVDKIDDYQAIFNDQIVNRISDLTDRFQTLPPDVIAKAKDYAGQFAGKASTFLVAFLSGLVSSLTSFSTFMFNFIVGIILAYFLSIEIESWKRLASEQTPNTFKSAFFFLRENVVKGIVSYIKAQAKLISLTFIVIFIALLVLNVNNAFSIALLSGVFDVLPLLGVSTLFIPWIIYLFIVGNTTLAIWLSALLLVVILVRQIMEPKITGESLGVSAFTTLAFMIISLSLFGVAGVILSPVLIILIKALHTQGYLQRWIRKPENEYAEGTLPYTGD
ncbi:sporulation integral membrane protein YtvI [Paenibacillus pectinilyticus]|uniref:Sporulation integral membrane protein YtvI n=1 Tax=Paenibacillus pectinilyticus TaxID=512399 RepID=A0A1C0ZUY6_9BACL|nr:sporulation integral membrane protein YtvI [Paenibacillus pectinilyticus]OCT11922.1 sporulation integral membrane protein YtvI [Paenibacillus pectinilyticus]